MAEASLQGRETAPIGLASLAAFSDLSLVALAPSNASLSVSTPLCVGDYRLRVTVEDLSNVDAVPLTTHFVIRVVEAAAVGATTHTRTS